MGEVIEQILAHLDTIPDASEAGAIVNWLRTGRITHDRTGHLARAQEAARAAAPLEVAGEREIVAAWRAIGYNVAHAKRYLASADPVAQEAVDLRLLYSLMDVVAHYFTVRRVPWRGEKSALRYLAAKDPAFLARLRRCLAERDRQRKVQQYEELAQLALAPVGRLWEVGTTVVAPGRGYGALPLPAQSPTIPVEDGLTFWQGLLGIGSSEAR